MLKIIRSNALVSSLSIQLNARGLHKKSRSQPLDLALRKQKSNTTFGINSFNDGFGGVKREFRIPEDRNKNFILKGKSNEFMHGLKETVTDEDPQSMFELEKDLDLFANDENLYHAEVIQEDMKKNMSRKLGIIKKKMKRLNGEKHTYFNLLTWDAKEQIKYLHLQDPEFWTPEKIADSYPISEENVKKLLKSKWSPKTLDDLANHDQKVIDNWRSLTESSEPRGPAINIYEELKETNRMALLKYACGLPDVEFERQAVIYKDSYAIHESILCKPGRFSSIIEKNDKIMRLFDKSEDLSINKSSTKRVKSTLDEHLVTTKSELVKSLNKLNKTSEKSELVETCRAGRRAKRTVN